MFKIGNITLDCEDVLRTAAFWSAVLDRPVDDGSSDAFASIGGADTERSESAWYFNKVAESRTAKNRLHVDFINP
ncbi:MAG TPA: VOC family protein, partial [Acidimicrobiales bacterium]